MGQKEVRRMRNARHESTHQKTIKKKKKKTGTVQQMHLREVINVVGASVVT